MRFARSPRHESFQWTPRKLAHAEKRVERALSKQSAQYPLLAPVLPKPEAFDANAELAARQSTRSQAERRTRDFTARFWRESRRDYFAASDQQREKIRDAWNQWRGPTTVLYFRYLVDLHTGVMEERSRRAREDAKALRQKLFANMPVQESLLEGAFA